MALGSLVLVGEDEPTSFYNTLLKYFLVEGLAHGHKVIRCAHDAAGRAGKAYFRSLPRDVSAESEKETELEMKKIAVINANACYSFALFIVFTLPFLLPPVCSCSSSLFRRLNNTTSPSPGATVNT